VVFEVYPAIDLKGGRPAWLLRGDASTLRARDDSDPVAAARAWVEEGARWVHVVDLDAALEGRAAPANLGVLERIAALPVRVQAGGGLSAEDVERALARGAARAVLGAAAAGDRASCLPLFERHGSRVALGLDVRGDRIEPRGGRHPASPLDEALAWLATARPGPGALVVTDVDRDGTMAGPNLALVGMVAERTLIPVIASGGVSSLDDLRALARAGAVGAVVGRALENGVFTLRQALEAAS
jgi:phosphoribosylformimino-5-aminoimidazole carboxamide ribonucleotide (ProFAR) isomerase